LKTQKKINFFNIGFKISDLLFLFKEIMGGRSYMRASHNLYLKKNLSLKNLTADLGSGKKNDYKKLIFKNIGYVENFDFYQTNKFTKKINLEKKFILKKKYENILLFNVLEHMENKDVLIQSIYKSLKKKGRLELFVPFMFRYHGDPNDYYRFTHLYLKKFLEKNGFKVKITLIGAGQFNVILEILFKYFKLDILKIIISPIFILLNKIFYFASRDFKNYYCGIHCSCIKIK
jgi:SAM-dependent methyltransferase